MDKRCLTITVSGFELTVHTKLLLLYVVGEAYSIYPNCMAAAKRDYSNGILRTANHAPRTKRVPSLWYYFERPHTRMSQSRLCETIPVRNEDLSLVRVLWQIQITASSDSMHYILLKAIVLIVTLDVTLRFYGRCNYALFRHALFVSIQ